MHCQEGLFLKLLSYIHFTWNPSESKKAPCFGAASGNANQLIYPVHSKSRNFRQFELKDLCREEGIGKSIVSIVAFQAVFFHYTIESQIGCGASALFRQPMLDRDNVHRFPLQPNSNLLKMLPEEPIIKFDRMTNQDAIRPLEDFPGNFLEYRSFLKVALAYAVVFH